MVFDYTFSIYIATSTITVAAGTVIGCVRDRLAGAETGCISYG